MPEGDRVDLEFQCRQWPADPPRLGCSALYREEEIMRMEVELFPALVALLERVGEIDRRLAASWVQKSPGNITVVRGPSPSPQMSSVITQSFPCSAVL
jgi:hypothetical protein